MEKVNNTDLGLHFSDGACEVVTIKHEVIEGVDVAVPDSNEEDSLALLNKYVNLYY